MFKNQPIDMLVHNTGAGRVEYEKLVVMKQRAE